MRGALLTFIFLFNSIALVAQFGAQQIITTEAELAVRVIPHDLNSDGFLDVIYTKRNGISNIVWRENLDGQGNFGDERFLSGTIPAVEDIELYDLNNDGKLDILYRNTPGKLAWIENLDGQGGFSEEKLIDATHYPYSMASSDIDNDGDLDIITIVHSSSIENSIVLYENIDGLGNFSAGTFIYTENDFFTDFSLIDYNSDNLPDIIISMNFGPPALLLFENLGGTFNTPINIYQFTYSQSDWTYVNNITVTDINNDEKQDLLIDTSYFGNFTEENIYWLENLDEAGTFSEPKFIDSEYTQSKSLRTYDIDSDGDMDILAAIYVHNHNQNSSIIWYENQNGLGQFGSKQVITTNLIRAKDATAGDINNDGYIDVISASSYDNKIAWYQSSGTFGLSEEKLKSISLYPNPTKNRIYIEAIDEIEKVKLYTPLGQLISTQFNSNELNIEKLPVGVYVIKIFLRDGYVSSHKIIKK